MKSLPKGQKEAYQKVSDYIQKHGCNTTTAIKDLGISSSQYYKARRFYENGGI